MTEYVCTKHPDRLVVEPIAHRRCQQCKTDAEQRYVDTWIKRSRDWQSSYDGRDDMTPDGRNIRTATANHQAHYLARKEKDE